MTSSELGLDIKKTLLSKTTLGKVSGVDKTLQKAAKNYLLLGKISHNLNLINQNIINLVRAFGIEAREKEDAHFLKENEREINFRVRREKYIESKVKKVDPDGDSSGGSGILGWFVRKKIKKFVKKIATRVMLKLRKNQYFKSLVKLINKFKRQIRDFFKKLDFKKIIVEWWREKGKPFVKGLLEKGFELLKKLGPLFKRALPRLTARLATIMASSAAAGPFAPIIAIVVTAGFVLYDGIMGAIEEVASGGNGYVGFFSGILEGITFGIFDRKLIADKMYQVGNFFKKVYVKIREVIKLSVDFIVKKIDDIIKPIFEDSKKKFDTSGKEKEYEKIVEEELLNYEKEQKAIEEALKKETAYVTELANNNRKKFEVKRRLIDEINTLQNEENEAEQKIAAAEGRKPPEKVPTLPKAERKERFPVKPAKPEEPPKPAPTPPVKPPVKPPAPPVKPPVKPTEPVQPQKPTKEKDGDMLDRARGLVKELIRLGVKNKHALKGILLTSAKESGINPSSSEMGAKGYLKQSQDLRRIYKYGKKEGLTGPERIREVFPQLKTADGGKYMNDAELPKLFMDDINFYDLAYGHLSSSGRKMGNTEPGDGFKYRGRSYVQITYKNTYKKIGDVIKQPLVSNPELLESNPVISAEATLVYLASSLGQGNVNRGIERMNAFTSDEEALKFIILNVARGSAGLNATHEYLKTANYEEQITQAKKKGSLVAEMATKDVGIGGEGTGPLSNSFVATEPETGKKIIYDSKEMFLGHREQKKPTNVDVVNITQTENTKLFKKTAKAELKKYDSVDLLLSRVV